MLSLVPLANWPTRFPRALGSERIFARDLCTYAMSLVGRLAGLVFSFCGAAAAGAVALPLAAGAAGLSAWACRGGTAGALAEAAGVGLPWVGGFAVGASVAGATGCELEFPAAPAGTLGVPAVPGAGDAGFCCNSALTSGRSPLW